MTAFVTGQDNHIALLNQLSTGSKNLVINGGFTVNQRGWASAAVLASGSYGHDRWKAGASGGDYSFTQLPSSTQITIAASKTLIQVIEDKFVVGGQYVLSWEGTCQARYGLNSATPSGSYASSPIVITGQTAGTTMSIEFGNGASAGTLGKVHLELANADATDYEQRPYPIELQLCRRYYRRIAKGSSNLVIGVGQVASTTTAKVIIHYEAMRAEPTLGNSTATNFIFQNAGANTAVTTLGLSNAGLDTAQIDVAVAAGLTAGQSGQLSNTNANSYIEFVAEL